MSVATIVDLFGSEEFRADLAELDTSTRDGWRRWAAEASTPTPAPEPEPAEPATADSPPASTAREGARQASATASPTWLGDRRMVRPIQVIVHLPVTTALGLDNEPGFIAGYGWVNAPQCRQWLPSAELRQACVSSLGQVVDLTDRVTRPEPTPAGVRTALLDMVRDPGPITEKTYREEPRHDPSPALAAFVDIRDLFCDGPTGARIPAPRADKDHEHPYPAGPTAAYNLVARGRRTHLLKHRGWIPWRTATSTLWFSPAGQIVEVPRNQQPPPDIDAQAVLPDPDALHEIDTYLVEPPEDEPPFDEPPF